MNQVYKTMKRIASLWVMGLAISASADYLDPATDKPGEEWCYLGKSTTVIGVPFQRDVTQITYDGALYTRNAELCFFYGPGDTPLLARGKTFMNGWLPIVQYAWVEGEVTYDIEYFTSPLDEVGPENPVNFVQLRMRNTGSSKMTGSFGAALRYSGVDCRYGPMWGRHWQSQDMRFSQDWNYEMTEGGVMRDGKLVYTFSSGGTREALPNVPYEKSFVGKDQGIGVSTACCLVCYRKDLNPGEVFTATFKMPGVPRALAPYNDKVLAADYDQHRAKTVAFWNDLFKDAALVELPEKRVQAAFRASLTHVLLATRNIGKRYQTDGLPYPMFFLTSMPEMVMLYLASGLPGYSSDLLVPGAIGQQKPDGLFYDKAVAHNKIIPAAQGHILYCMAQTALFTQDRAFAETNYPSIRKGVEYIASSISNDPHGLLPEAWPFDNEMIDGHYASHNMVALMGLRYAVRLARFLGRTDDVTAWTKLALKYEDNILKAIDHSAKPDGYVPPGLYDYKIGKASSRPSFPIYRYEQDWENMILSWPTELLAPWDAKVSGTLAHIRKGYAEGIMTYFKGEALHQYITANMIQQYLVRGETYTALKDFYHLLLHSGSTHEAFEHTVRPWADRRVDPGCPTPHAWGSAKQGQTIRNLLVLEYGGRCGLDAGQRELWLFHALSPAWVKAGEHVAVRNLPTEFGKITAEMTFSEAGANLMFNGAFHEKPAWIRVRMPYFKQLVGFKTDAGQSKQEGDCILMSPDVRSVAIEWKDKPGAHLHTAEDILTDYRSANRFKGVDQDKKAIIEPGKPFVLDNEKSETPQPLSFELVKNTFLHEYARLASQPGVKVIQINAPAIKK
jgi:hypothetical protein